MSIFSSILRTAYKLSGAKKAFGLPENEIRKVIDKQNRSRGVFIPTDCKAHYEMITVNGFPCLIVRENPMHLSARSSTSLAAAWSSVRTKGISPSCAS